ncbi:hypothetical protein LTR99_008687 [Exophiala xenobiotica]|uniref:Calcium uniporter protein n=1 Tax=Vermiconidia calcicola TaxID=1690605 RepID=A0AAV9Q1J6_9PEZI|nr:hypothetical protein LTR96_008957 [Exophiala xenobiotica]KAK5533332.1 hypothetical protein LTR25_007197 [Vermiconidia calcicola]KAK5534286.1 hypothetical protein LTR23_008836 [Chaetothyriales sp. CCFEE 6169]KAK5296321.1 hypothetical protein LTR99_008687 [Exophiala xenobiotica]KAK5334374.1 hypothetical protein LTR98_009327 [Exophiala xenobiotica]
MRLINPARQLLQTRGLHQVSIRASLDPHGPSHSQTCSQLLKRPQPRPLSRTGLSRSTTRGISGEQKAKNLNQQGIDEALADFDTAIAEEGKDKQQRAPWHRQGAQEPPVKRQRSAGAMTKGKLLTTPSRLLKLVLPLTTLDHNSDRKDVAPLALLVHPQQPLSYLERLIQSELPSVSTEKGSNRVPGVSFRAMESPSDEIKPKKELPREEKEDKESQKENLHDGGVESYSGAGREGEGEEKGDFVRWSASTEIGDFIRDAARAKEFEVEIEGSPRTIKVAVPSFNDRTFYLRQRLRRMSKQLADMASIKKECDLAAHRGGQRIAMGGCGILVGWWYVVYRLTFETDLGWDVMEPVTYLVGLSTIIGGYMWFLYHNREVSYRSALSLTISKRQSKLYEQKGFDIRKWEVLLEEANAIRREIKAVAGEYDVEWDEVKDEHDPEVANALREDRKKNQNGQKKKKGDKGDEDEDDD